MTNLKLKSAGISKFNSSEYLRLMRMAHTQMLKTGIEALNISAEQFAVLGQKIEIFNDVFAQSKAMSETTTLQSLDALRDEQWVYLLNRIRNAEKSPIPAEREASKALSLEVKPYIGKQRIALELQTELVNGLLFDLSKSKNQEPVKTLHLEPSMQALQEANENFDTAFIQRNTQKQVDKLPTLSELRKEIDTLYLYCAERITATHTLTPTEKTSQCILELNGFIDSINLIYTKRNSTTEKGEKPSPPESEQ